MIFNYYIMSGENKLPDKILNKKHYISYLKKKKEKDKLNVLIFSKPVGY